jgi:hypothetical protein
VSISLARTCIVTVIGGTFLLLLDRAAGVSTTPDPTTPGAIAVTGLDGPTPHAIDTSGLEPARISRSSTRSA